MIDEEQIIVDDEEYEKMTQNQKKQYIQNLKSRKSLALSDINELLKELAYKGENTEIIILEQDDSKRIQKVNRPGNVRNLPQTIDGPKYPQIFDKTGMPKK